MALELREHEPDLFNHIAQYLEPGELHWGLPFNSEARVKLFEIGKPIYSAELERVIKGEKRQQKHNALLTTSQQFALDQLRWRVKHTRRESMKRDDKERYLSIAQDFINYDIEDARKKLEFDPQDG